MPNTNSARKSLRVGERRNVENRKIKLAIRKVMKNASVETLPEVFSTLDKAAKKNIMHENKAARLKSRVSARVSKMGTEIVKEVKKAVVKKTAAKKAAVKKAIVKKTTEKKAAAK